MKIFLYNKNAGQIGKILQNEGYEIINKNSDSGYKILLDKISQSELCLFECTRESFSLGFLIEKALEMEKPVIALGAKNHLPQFIKSVESEKFQAVEYTKNNLVKVIKTAINAAALLSDKRFNFFVSSNMLAYINKMSKKLGVTKSTFIRNLIEEHKKKESLA